MILFFQNPISLIVYSVIHQKTVNPLQAYYVNAVSDLPEHIAHYKTLNAVWFQQAEQIGKKLDITIKNIEPSSLINFKNKEVEIITDSTTTDILDDTFPIILQAGDNYCGLGFNNYARFFRTKFKLERSWKNTLNLKNREQVYYFSHKKSHLSYKNFKVIDSKNTQKTLNLVDDSIRSSLLPKMEFNTDLEYLLVLPPSINCNSKFFKEFFKRVNTIASREKLKVIVKPHRNSRCNYLDYIDEKKIIDLNQADSKFINVEFLFSIKNIKKIICVPSSALAFIDPNVALTLMPKDKNEYRTRYLDQVPFLEFLNLSYERI
jgi:hypothetical protein